MELRFALKMMRDELSITQMELAAALQVSYSAISKWERGKSFPKRNVALMLLDYAESSEVSKECQAELERSLAEATRKKVDSADTSSPVDEQTILQHLIDDVSFPIYICDIDSYDLLYVNHRAEEMLGGCLEQLDNRKCHKCLMHRDKPCPFCYKDKLVEDSFMSFDVYRPDRSMTGRSHARLINWNGKKAQVCYITENTLAETTGNDVSAATYREHFRHGQRIDGEEESVTRTVLVVDDNALERTMLAGILEDEYEIISASDGKEALSILRKNASIVSAVLLDLAMPDMDGFETLSEIRKDETCRHIPVVISSMLTDTNSHVKAISLGADGNTFKPFQRELLLHQLKHCIDLREMKALASALSKDALTGIDNRAAFLEKVERMVHQEEPGFYVLSCFDVENFKLINDRYGPKVGDEILRHIADTIDAGIQTSGGACCRYSADRFGVLYPAVLKDSEAMSFIREKLSLSPHLERPMKMRIGRYLVCDLSLPASAMFDRATLAEESIRGKFDCHMAYYDDSMLEGLIHEQQVIDDMVPALQNGEFEPFFQPQYDHSTGSLAGAEALIRWKKDGRIITPDSFIEIFERNGFIYEVDRYIWRKVCVWLRRWLDEGRPPLPISVNVSRYDIYQERFVTDLVSLVKEYSLPFELLRLEVTESAFSESASVLVDVVTELVKRGFTIEIDDFGSGYSSLNTLKDVPASILKLDMKFFERTDNSNRSNAILESIVHMAKRLGMEIIAEGVEDAALADYLDSIGCRYIQGYFYAKPMPQEEFEALVLKS